MHPDASPQLAALRQELQRIDHQVPLQAQAEAVDRLRGTYRHSIALIEEADGQGGPKAYNCLMYALDLCGLDEALLKNFEAKVQQLNIESEFVRELLEGGLEKVPDEQAGEKSVAIYFSGGVPVHAALLVQDGLVRSKWGMGHLWQHRLFEVSAEYGDEVKFFRRLRRGKIVNRYTSHVKGLIKAKAQSGDTS